MQSVSTAFQSASGLMLGAAQDVAEGNLDNFASDAESMIVAQTEAGAASALSRASQDMSRYLLDMKV